MMTYHLMPSMTECRALIQERNAPIETRIEKVYKSLNTTLTTIQRQATLKSEKILVSIDYGDGRGQRYYIHPKGKKSNEIQRLRNRKKHQ